MDKAEAAEIVGRFAQEWQGGERFQIEHELITEIEKYDWGCSFTTGDEPGILAIGDGYLIVYSRHGDALDKVEWGAIRGIWVTTHRTVDGLEYTGWTINHAMFPDAMVIDAAQVSRSDRATFAERFAPFVMPHP